MSAKSVSSGPDPGERWEQTPTAAAPPKKFSWKPLLRWAIAIVVVAALGFSIQRAIEHWQAQPEAARLRLRDLHGGWLVASALAYAGSLFPAAFVLSRTLRSVGATPPFRYVVAAQLIGHLGKYVPGKAMVVLIRMDWIQRSGLAVGLRATTIAIMIETLTMIATGAMLGLVLVLFMEVPSIVKQASAVLALGAAVGLSPPVLKLVMARKLVGGLLPFQWRSIDVLIAWTWNLLGWLLMGASTTAVLYALPESIRPATSASWWLVYITCLASIAMAYTAGFLSLLPGGAGVRELVLTSLLTGVVGPTAAIVSAFLIRMIHLIVEVVLSAAAYGLVHKVERQAPTVAKNEESD